jgi:propanol-preferring alcohol dehydrogenase
MPRPEPTEVLVRLSHSGICGTDIGLATTLLGGHDESNVLGHEGVGNIELLGSALTPSPTLRVGLRVGVGWIRDMCRSCDLCMSGHGETHCRTKTFSGVHVPGTLQQYITVPAAHLMVLTEDVEPQLQAPIMCAGVTAYKAIKTADAVSGSWMLISGAGGGVGSLAVQYAVAMGYRVIGVDVGINKGVSCMNMGCEKFIDLEMEHDMTAFVKHATGGKMVSAALVCIGNTKAYEAALECVGSFGTLVSVGIPPPGLQGLMAVHPLKLIQEGIKVTGSLVGSRGDIAEAMEFVRRGVVTPKVKIITMDELDYYARQVGKIEAKLVVTLN